MTPSTDPKPDAARGTDALAFTPIRLNELMLKNRLFSSGHQTGLAADHKIGSALMAYHEARAMGGVGLIITEAGWVDPRALSSGICLNLSVDECIDGFSRLKERTDRYGCRLFGQLFHPGREYGTSIDGSLSVAYAPSAIPNERHHIMPRALSRVMIQEIVGLYARAAGRLSRAGIDGTELMVSHGYLPAAFLNPNANHRQDEYGGSLENRLRFVREIVAAIRNEVGRQFVVGVRICGNDASVFGPDPDEVVEACASLDVQGTIDYFNVASGSSVDLLSTVHYIPPMGLVTADAARAAAAIRGRVSRPVLVVGRITASGQVEHLLRTGAADMVGMARALICDPQLPNKIAAGRTDEIRECIGCNQACIGHLDRGGYGISCIQNPASGRELIYPRLVRTVASRRILVVGGGPGGLKAAAVAAERGHRVTLCERANQLGGQARLAQLLPSRAEFGGLIANLSKEAVMHGVELRLGTMVDRAVVEAYDADAVVLATGARPRVPDIPGVNDARVLDAWETLSGRVEVGSRVIVADWRCDWIGLGLAEKLARQGSTVRLACTGQIAGEAIQKQTRDRWIGDLHRLAVQILPYLRLFGIDGDTAFFQHILSDEAVELSGWDSMILAHGHQSDTALESQLVGYDRELHFLGDCLAPRTAEEAVLEGLQVGSRL